MATTGIVNAKTRTVTGSSEARRLRREGQIPCVLQALDHAPTTLLQVSAHEVKMMLRHHAGENLVLNLIVDDQEPRKVLLKEVQHDPITGALVHMDFLEVSMTEKMQASAQIVLIGDPKGVTQGGGVLEHLLREIEVECLPDDMVEEISADVSGLDIGEMLHTGDLQLPAGVTALTPPDIAIALVSAPRTEEAAAEDEAATGGEPELVAGKKVEADDNAAAEKKTGKG